MIPADQPTSATGQGASGEPRIAVLVLGCLLTVYDRCIKIIRSTWGSRTAAGIDIYYVYGGQSGQHRQAEMVDVEQLIGRPRPHLRDGEIWASGDVILCGTADVREDQMNCILRKRLLAFGYLASHLAYDFVYTVCACSYVDLAELKRYVAGLPAAGVYHGALAVDRETGYPFVSGASFLLSRDLAADLANDFAAIVTSYPEEIADDVVIGHCIASKHGRASPARIADHIAKNSRPTDNQTFVMPYGQGSVDFVSAPAYSQVPRQRSYHFHFNSQRMWDMENFHRRFFSA